MKKQLLVLTLIVNTLFISTAFADNVPSVLETALQVEKKSTFMIKNNETISNWQNAFGNRQQSQKLTIKGNFNTIKSDNINSPSLVGIIVNKPNDSNEILSKKQVLSLSNFILESFKTALTNYGGTVNISSMIFNKNITSENGGAVYNDSGVVNINGSSKNYASFTLNKAISGGAVFNNGTLNMKNTVVGGRKIDYVRHIDETTGLESDVAVITSLGNIANFGGGVYNANIANISGVSFIYNTAEYDGGGLYNTGKLTLSSSVFEDNKAINGGAVYTLYTGDNAKHVVNISKSKFYNNTATTSGGAVYVQSGKTIINKSTFGSQFGNGNSAVNGGAIYNSGADTQIISSSFSQNYANKGGDIFNTGTMTISKSTFGYAPKKNYFSIGVLNKWTVAGKTDYSNVRDNFEGIDIVKIPIDELYGSSAKQGGAIFNQANMIINSSKFMYASAIEGGAIYNDENGTLTINKSNFVNNSAKNKSTTPDDEKVADSDLKGGAIYNKGNISIIKSTFDGNIAENGIGGGIYNAEGFVSMTGSTLKNNSAKQGGAIYNNAKMNITSSTFILNNADEGGAIYNGSKGNLTLTKVTFGNAKKKQKYTNNAQYGSALYNAGIANIDSSTITYNNSVYGAICNEGDLKVNKTTFSYNTADYGAGIYSKIASDTKVVGSTFNKNTSLQGGAIYNNADLNVSSSKFTSNTATGKIYEDENGDEIEIGSFGGAIYNLGDMTIDKTTFSSNKAVNGGAIYNLKDAIITQSTFTSNSSTAYGGAIYNAGYSSADIKGSSFSKNKSFYGGAIYNDTNSSITFDSKKYTEIVKKKEVEKIAYNEFTKNSALHGGAIYNVGTIGVNSSSEESFLYLSGKFTSNSATYSNKSFTITNEDINNESKYYTAKGGAIFNYGTLLEDKQIEYNNKICKLGSSFAITTIGDKQIIYNNDNKHNYVYDYSSQSSMKNFSFGTNMANKIVYNGFIYDLEDKNITVSDYTSTTVLTDNQILYNGKLYDVSKVENPEKYVACSNLATGEFVYNGKIFKVTDGKRQAGDYDPTKPLGEKQIAYRGYVYDLSKIDESKLKDYVSDSTQISDDQIVIRGTVYKLVDGRDYDHNSNIEDNEILFNGKIYKIAADTKVSDYKAPTEISNGQIIVSNTVYKLNEDSLLKDNDQALIYLDKNNIDKENQIVYKGHVYNYSDLTEIGDYITGKLTIDKGIFTSNTAKNKVVLNVEKYKDDKTKNEVSKQITMYAGKGGAIYNSSSAELNISNSTFTKNSSSQAGGAICNENTGNDLVIKNSKFTSNSVKSTVTTVTTTYLTNGKKTKKTEKTTVGDGGAIYTLGNLYINSKDDETQTTIFEKNSAVNGGAIFSQGVLGIYNTTFSANSAVNGGAIYINKAGDTNDTETTSIVSKSLFEKNKADNGAGVYNAGEVTFENNIFNSNVAKVAGGAIYNTGTLIQKVATFTNNKSINGGALYNAGTYTDETIDGDKTTTENVTKLFTKFENNTATFGGAIYNVGTLTLKGTYFNGNYAIYGGTIYNAGKVTLEDVTFDNTNKVINIVGGVIYNYGSFDIKGSHFNKNLASAYGGAIFNTSYMFWAGVMTSSKNEFKENESSYGGAIFSNAGTFTSTEDYFEGNKANFGGAIYNTSVLKLENSKFVKNEGVYGGAILSSKTINIKGGEFSENDGYWAGAIYAGSSTTEDKKGNLVLGGTVTIDGTTFKGNYGRINAGALYVASSNTIIENAIFDGNHADAYGGAILIATSDDIAKINSTTFKGNYVNANGGAIYNSGNLKVNIVEKKDEKVSSGDDSTSSENNDIKYTTTIFDSNKADNGGAIYNAGKVIADNVKFTNNKITCNGGGINNTGYVKLTNAIFESNIADSTKIENKGGAIYNNPTITESTEEKPQGLNVSTSAFGSNEADLGGAIYSVNLLTISDTIFGGTRKETYEEQVDTGKTDKDGKPIYETVTKEKDVTYGGNVAKKSGGAIYNKGQAIISNTEFHNNSAVNSGGAIYNEYFLQIGEININDEGKTDLDVYNETKHTNIFVENSSKNGGAIYHSTNNYLFYVNGASFTKNTASLNGGAIYNNGYMVVNNIKFDSNVAKGDGGAIYNTGKNDRSGIYNSLFVNNSAVNGGAIYTNTGKVNYQLTIQQVKFGQYDEVNKTTSDGNIASGNGGALYIGSKSKVNIINSGFFGNKAQNGGAIYAGTNSNITIQDTSFINNTASGQGGAIYADKNSTVNIIAQNDNVVFKGNTAKGESNSIYLNNATLNLLTYDDKWIYINDDIAGDGKISKMGNIYISNESDIQNMTIQNNSGVIALQSEKSLQACSLEMVNNSALNIANGRIGTLALKALSFENNSTSNIAIDIDLKNGLSDKVTAEEVVGNGVLNVSNVNIIANSKTPTTINVGENSSVTAISAKTAESAEATYKLRNFVDENGMLRTVAYGQKAKPCAVAAPVAAQLGGYLTQINSYDQAFMNMDMNMLQPYSERVGDNANSNAIQNRYSNRYASTDESYTGYSENNGINYNSKGLWTRPYATFERVNLSGGPKVSNIAYGNFFGGDADIKYMNNGWSRQFSAYIGYNGSTQDYVAQSIDQNGGNIGLTEVWYKNNFFTGLTVNVGANVAQASTDIGRENIPMLMAGLASKSGYNFEFKNGKFIIQPSLLLSYTFVHSFSHENGRGSHIGSSPLNAIQVVPGLKFIFNLPKGWQPYLGVNMRWNIIDKTHFSMQDVTIPDMSIDPYVEYGIGVQRKWGERFTGYGQAMIRNGGRNGVMLSFGFKWALGK